MRICVLSQDPDIARLCREVLEGYSIPGLTMISAAPESGRHTADLYVVDFHPNQDFPKTLSSEEFHKAIFLVGRSDVATLRKTVPRLPLTVLLRPVSRARLEIAFEQAFSHARNGCSQVLHEDDSNLLQHLLQANVRLQEYDQDRTNFIGRAVHEFRAPLTSVNGYCGLLLSGTLGALSPEQREAIDRMRYSVTRLSRLTSSLFELSVGDKVERAPDLQTGDLLNCIERTLDTIGPVCQERRITLDLQFNPPTSELYFASEQIEQVLLNLLENSCKFSPKGGHIQVCAHPYFWERRTSNGWPPAGAERRRRPSSAFNAYRIDILDNGPGIPPEHVDTIFEEYTTYAGGGDRSGAGLGLAICRIILRTHGGRIWAERNSSGAKFSFVLPYGGPQVQKTAAPLRFRRAAGDPAPALTL
jgi:signal transduction histidine kinase